MGWTIAISNNKKIKFQTKSLRLTFSRINIDDTVYMINRTPK